MKKIVLISALLGGIFLYGQIDLRDTRFGITAGPTFSAVLHAHSSSGQRYAFFAGGLVLIPISSNDQFYIQSEVLYVSAGETGNLKYEKLKGIPHAIYALNYLSVPITLKAYISPDENSFFVLGGPSFDFLISQVNKNIPKKKDPDYRTSGDNSYGKASAFNLGLAGGLGYSFRRQLEISLKLEAGLSDVFPDLKKSPADLASGDPSVLKNKTQYIASFGLSYLFQ